MKDCGVLRAEFDAVATGKYWTACTYRQAADILRRIHPDTTQEAAAVAVLTRRGRAGEVAEWEEVADDRTIDLNDLGYAEKVLIGPDVYPHEGYVDVDAALVALGAERDWDNPNAPRGCDSVWKIQELDLERHGILRRMLAALKSAPARGAVKFDSEFVSEPISETDGENHVISRRMRIEISSPGGVWSSRAYRMVTVVTIMEDEYGWSGYVPSRGAIRVTPRDGSETEATVFGGGVAGKLIASLFFEQGVARNTISEWLQEEEESRWVPALAELAEAFAVDAQDLSAALVFTQAVTNGLDEEQALAALWDITSLIGDDLGTRIHNWIRRPGPNERLTDAVDGLIHPGCLKPGLFDNAGQLFDDAVVHARRQVAVASESDAELRKRLEHVAARVVADPHGRKLVEHVGDDVLEVDLRRLEVTIEAITGHRCKVSCRYEEPDGDPVGYLIRLDYPVPGCSDLRVRLEV